MAVKYKDLKEAGRTDTIREMTREEMLYGKPEGYETLEVYSPYNPQEVAGRGNWGIGDNAFMSDDDYNTLKGYQSQWFTAQAANDQAGMDAAHEAAQQLRYKYGYSGGADGSKYNTVIADVSGLDLGRDKDVVWARGGYKDYGGGGFNNSGFNSQYQARIDALTDAILNREAFQYDKESDPLYQQYADSYTRSGQRAMQDTLAQVSARTGGLASSYAGSASQQAFNNYMAALADKVPELYQMRYSMYQDDLANQRADLDMLMGLDDRDFGRYTNERDFNYGAYRDGVGDSQWQQQFDYNAHRDAVSDARYDQEWAYQLEQDALARALEQQELENELAVAMAKAAGKTSNNQTPTPGAGGLDASVVATIAKAYPDRVIPASDWQRMVAKYGEAALAAAGFSQGAPTAGGYSEDYGEVLDLLREMKDEEVQVGEIREMLKEALNGGSITQEEYLKLVNQTR